MSSIAIYPGSFDPVTFGHLDLMERASKMFDRIIVAVAHDTPKNSLFDINERIEMLKESTSGMNGIIIEAFDGLVINFARKKKVHVIIRGLRMISDFEYELQMALTNRRLGKDIETVFLMPSEGNSFLSSTLIKQAASLGADMSSFVPENVIKCFEEKFKLTMEKVRNEGLY